MGARSSGHNIIRASCIDTICSRSKTWAMEPPWPHLEELIARGGGANFPLGRGPDCPECDSTETLRRKAFEEIEYFLSQAGVTRSSAAAKQIRDSAIQFAANPANAKLLEDLFTPWVIDPAEGHEPPDTWWTYVQNFVPAEAVLPVARWLERLSTWPPFGDPFPDGRCS